MASSDKSAPQDLLSCRSCVNIKNSDNFCPECGLKLNSDVSDISADAGVNIADAQCSVEILDEEPPVRLRQCESIIHHHHNSACVQETLLGPDADLTQKMDTHSDQLPDAAEMNSALQEQHQHEIIEQQRQMSIEEQSQAKLNEELDNIIVEVNFKQQCTHDSGQMQGGAGVAAPTESGVRCEKLKVASSTRESRLLGQQPKDKASSGRQFLSVAESSSQHREKQMKSSISTDLTGHGLMKPSSSQQRGSVYKRVHNQVDSSMTQEDNKRQRSSSCGSSNVPAIKSLTLGNSTERRSKTPPPKEQNTTEPGATAELEESTGCAIYKGENAYDGANRNPHESESKQKRSWVEKTKDKAKDWLKLRGRNEKAEKRPPSGASVNQAANSAPFNKNNSTKSPACNSLQLTENATFMSVTTITLDSKHQQQSISIPKSPTRNPSPVTKGVSLAQRKTASQTKVNLQLQNTHSSGISDGTCMVTRSMTTENGKPLGIPSESANSDDQAGNVASVASNHATEVKKKVENRLSVGSSVDDKPAGGIISAATAEKQEKCSIGSQINTGQFGEKNTVIKDDAVLVHFHVVLPANLGFDKYTNVFIEFKDGIRHSMQFERHIRFSSYATDLLLMFCHDQRIVSRDCKTSEYNYCCIQRQNEEFKEKVSSVYRKLSIRDEPRVLEWHQYDGVATPGASWVKKIFGSIVADPHQLQSLVAGLAAMPKWKGNSIELHIKSDMVAWQALDDLDNITRCLEKSFVNLHGAVQGKKFKDEVLGAFVKKSIEINLTKQFENGNPSEGDNSLILASAMSLVYIIVKYDLRCDRDLAGVLCNGLLLRPNIQQRSCQSFCDLLNVHFPNKQQVLDDILLKFIERIGGQPNYIQPLWFLLVPLLHFVGEESRPFELLPEKEKYNGTGTNWWGDQKITKVKDIFKRSFDIPIRLVIERLVPLFELDMLLPRTLLAVVSFRHLPELPLEKFPIEACLANLSHFVKFDYVDLQMIPQFLKQISVNIDQIINSPAPVLSSELCHAAVNNADQICNIAMHLLLDTFNRVTESQFDVITAVLSMVFKGFSVLCIQHDIAKEFKLQDVSILHNNISGLFTEAIDMSKNWYWMYIQKDGYPRHFSNSELELFNKWFAIQIPNRSLEQKWLDNVLGLLQSKLRRVSTDEVLRMYADKDFTKYTPQIGECFCKAAFDAVESASQEHLDRLATRSGTAYQHAPFRQLLSKIFMKSWPNVKESDENYLSTILNHLLHWKPFGRYLSLIHGQKNETFPLTNDCAVYITVAESVLASRISELFSGEITLANLNCFEDQANLLEILNLVDSDSTCIPRFGMFDKEFVLQKVLDWRKTEEKEYTRLHFLLTNLVNMSHDLKSPALNDLKQKLFASQRETTKIIEICQPKEVTEQNLIDKAIYMPVITCFKLSSQLRDILPELVQLNNSSVFRHIWKRYSALELRKSTQLPVDGIPDVGISATDLWSTIRKVWSSCSTEWNELCGELKDGSLLTSRVDQVFGPFQKDSEDYNLIRAEINLMCGNTDLGETRLRQIKLYHECQHYQRGTVVILEAKKLLKLTGDFSGLEALQNMMDKSKDEPLDSISDIVLNNFDWMKTINEERVLCVRIFLKNYQLAKWLKDNLPEPKQVAVLVDLAIINAQGQGDYEIERVLCLQAAVRGYDSLIYKLQNYCSFEDFLKHCRDVFEALAADPKLPDKFRETANSIEWLDNIVHSHNSVDDNALKWAEDINSNAVISVGHLHTDDRQDDRSLDSTLSLEFQLIPLKKEVLAFGHDEDNENEIGLLSLHQSIANLATRDCGEKVKTKTLRIQQLQDLQSKLMLIVGRSNEASHHVNKYQEILDASTRLARIYLDLCNAGCILFHRWKAIFRCDPTHKHNALMIFGENSVPLKGHTDGIIDLINQISSYLQQCLDEWMKHVDIQRCEYYHLNFFSAAQLVILQRELACLSSSSSVGLDDVSVNPHVYQLLWCIKQYVTLDELSSCLKSSFKIVETEFQRNAKERASDVFGAAEIEREELIDKRKKFVESMKDACIEEKVIEHALLVCNLDEIDDGILWCMEHETDDNDTDNAENAQEVHRLQVRQGVTFSDNTSELIKKLTSEDCLLSSLKELWAAFLEQKSTSVADYLSLRHTGCLLNELAKLSTTLNIDRSFSSMFHMGSPNLVVCAKSVVYRTILSIYMNYSVETHLPLPGSDEVFLCTTNTEGHEIELFCRRARGDALLDASNKVYCLAFADMLDYEVACAAEGILQKYCYVSGLRLVVICCRENEIKSHIVSVLDRHKIEVPVEESIAIQTYLKRQLIVDYDCQGLKNGWRPAAHIDPEKSSVRVVKSYRAGVGKTLKVRRMANEMKRQCQANNDDTNNNADDSGLITISLHSKTVDQIDVLKTLLSHVTCDLWPNDILTPRIFHIDVAHEIQSGVDHFLFNLIVLRSVCDPYGFVWRRMPHDLYIIECMPLVLRETSTTLSARQSPQFVLVHNIFDLLPSLTCWSPEDSQNILLHNDQAMRDKYPGWMECKYDQTMDETEFRSPTMQLPYQILQSHSKKELKIQVDPNITKGTFAECLRCLLDHCGINDPSWSELFNFFSFLNIQLTDARQSTFCSEFLQDDLPGFSEFVVRFMIRMSRDFATRSLTISEETPGFLPQLYYQQNHTGTFDNDIQSAPKTDILHQLSLKRRWEGSPHPYLFFNSDHQSFTFLGFIVELKTQNCLDPQTRKVIEHNIMPLTLQHALYRNQVDLDENFDNLPRERKIHKLCAVMGQMYPHDPDPTYELTTDNVKKMLAIYMRFRCNIPVIIMGETGCGKTELVKFMCHICLPVLPANAELENMILMKVHGGITEDDIVKKVSYAIKVSQDNARQYPNIFTVLFFDEANATEAIGLIKEIMCDHRMKGQPLPKTCNLHMIAACNPYRKHSAEMITKLEQAGLGYHISANETLDCLGHIPMRQLVYRVQALPQSMLPLVWDFGQLRKDVEILYIKQMVRRYLNMHQELFEMFNLDVQISNIIAKSQTFMRKQKNECSFVSLRDVDRLLTVMMWFYSNRDHVYRLMDQRAKDEFDGVRNRAFTSDHPVAYKPPTALLRSLILAIGVCYHTRLENRQSYRKCIGKKFTGLCALENSEHDILREITLCQDVFLDHVVLEDNIARNQALKENVFMMIVCIELRIPLFLVGKPGSSKSLAKIIVADAMQGMNARNEFFSRLHFAHMVSYQCSPLSTPEGIVETFKQCAHLQEANNKNKAGSGADKFVAVVVLDEVGLAEDSPKMPLKTLHPLLEDGCETDDNSKKLEDGCESDEQNEKLEEVWKTTDEEDDKLEDACENNDNGQKKATMIKVGFIGISNWALDPAKMNRGILVQRGVPDIDELAETARSICTKNDKVRKEMEQLVTPLAQGYADLCKETRNRPSDMKEFFGLRDFYSLIKMVAGFIKRSQTLPTKEELQHAIMRNFDGLDDVKPVEIFLKNLRNIKLSKKRDISNTMSGIGCDSKSLIEASLRGLDGLEGDSRYLLILTENYSALGLLEQELLLLENSTTIFGSSFRRDQEYTQVCRNINRIKMNMEAGKCVVLLNLENLYESLYDALNQYYVHLGDQQFVDLGLGTQRVKCRVAKNFRLIVIAEKAAVYRKFPIPLINRLEKHILSTNTMLSKTQMKLVKQLQEWAHQFATLKYNHTEMYGVASKDIKSPKEGDVFIGYHPDAASSIILQMYRKFNVVAQHSNDNEVNRNTRRKILRAAQDVLLMCATPDSVIRLKRSELSHMADEYHFKYFVEQPHDSLCDLLMKEMNSNYTENKAVFLQVTTHSLLLSRSECNDLADRLSIDRAAVTMSTLQSFDTEIQFCNQLDEIRRRSTEHKKQLFLLQSDSADANPDLIACARYNICNEFKNSDAAVINVVFVIQLQRVAGGYIVGFQGGRWKCYHVDDLHAQKEPLPDLTALKSKTISQLFEEANNADWNVRESDNKRDAREQYQFAEPHSTEMDESDRTMTTNDYHDEAMIYESVTMQDSAPERKGDDFCEEYSIASMDYDMCSGDHSPKLDERNEKTKLTAKQFVQGKAESISSQHLNEAEAEKESRDEEYDDMAKDMASQDNIKADTEDGENCEQDEWKLIIKNKEILEKDREIVEENNALQNGPVNYLVDENVSDGQQHEINEEDDNEEADAEADGIHDAGSAKEEFDDINVKHNDTSTEDKEVCSDNETDSGQSNEEETAAKYQEDSLEDVGEMLHYEIGTKLTDEEHANEKNDKADEEEEKDNDDEVEEADNEDETENLSECDEDWENACGDENEEQEQIEVEDENEDKRYCSKNNGEAEEEVNDENEQEEDALDDKASSAANSDLVSSFGDNLDEIDIEASEKSAKDYSLWIKQNESFSRFDVGFLVHSCMHQAVASVKDPVLTSASENVPGFSRKKRRLDILLTALASVPIEEENALSLMKVLRKRIALLLKDKETTAMIREQAGGWLTKEVSSMETIIKAGTFRRALWQHLQSRIIPLLSGIFSLADCCANLDLLEPNIHADRVNAMEESDNHTCRWKSMMWLEILNDPNIVHLEYRDLKSRNTGALLQDFYVKNIGANNIFFEMSCPFSWIIKQKIDEILVLETKCRTESMKQLFENTPLGRILAKYQLNHGAELLSSYIHDFVRIIYNPTSSFAELEYRLIMEDIKLEYDRSYDGQQTRGQHLLEINAIYDKVLRQRLNIFARFNQVWQESISSLANTKVEMPLDEKILVFIVETLLAQADTVDKETGVCDDVVTTIFLKTLTQEKVLPNGIELRRRAFLFRVKQIQPVVTQLMEKFLTSPSENSEIEGCRYRWNKICAIQMFIQHVCLSNEFPKQLTANKCIKLSMLLGEQTDFKTEHSLNSLEKFLIVNNKGASNYFKLGKCHHCTEALSNPVELPCTHAVCLTCFNELRILASFVCPLQSCAKPFQKDMPPTPLKSKTKEVTEHNSFRRRCNAFFLELVHSLCFAGNTPPDSNVVQKLINYVIFTRQVPEPAGTGQNLKSTRQQKFVVTKIMAPLEEIVDPTPIFRSFLLQLLLRSTIEDVRKYIDDYLTKSIDLLRSSGLANQGNESENILELCLLCVQCLEDHYRIVLASQYKAEEHFTRVMLRKVLESVSDDSDRLDLFKLEMIAKIRFLLALGARYISETEYESQSSLLPDSKAISDNNFNTLHHDHNPMEDKKKFLRDIANLCELDSFKWPRISLENNLEFLAAKFIDSYHRMAVVIVNYHRRYLMTLITRKHGAEAYLDLARRPNLHFIMLPEARPDQIDAMPDRFLVCGEDYKGVRNNVAQAALGSDCTQLGEILAAMNFMDSSKEYLLLLAVYREVTLSYVHVDANRTPQLHTIAKLTELGKACSFVKEKDLFDQLIMNTLPGTLKIVEKESTQRLILSEIVAHALIVWTILRKSKLQTPFTALQNNPASMHDVLLPTMPENDLLDLKNVIAPHHGESGVQGPTFYRCPKGHPYLVTECGRPTEVLHCKECGSRIGGLNHNPEADNEVFKISTDRKETGHIIGVASKDPRSSAIRFLNGSQSAIMRLLLHLSMYLGATVNPKDVHELIHPVIPEIQLEQFLFAHIQADITAIRHATGKGKDDVVLLMHLVLQRMIAAEINPKQSTDTSLTTRTNRQNWEKEYAKVYIAPCLADLEAQLGRTKHLLLSDSDRLGNNPLMRMIYEVDISHMDTPNDLAHIEQVSTMWRYRVPISIETLKRELDKIHSDGILNPVNASGGGDAKTTAQYPVLQLFLKQEHNLRLLRLLPSINDLQRLLSQYFGHRLDKSESMTLAVGGQEFLAFFNRDHLHNKVSQLIADFAEAWNAVRLTTEPLIAEERAIPDEYRDLVIDDRTPLAMFIPSNHGLGLCAVALVWFLCRVQNTFIDQYRTLSTEKSEISINVRDASHSQLISFDSQRDFLQMLLGNCSYVLEAGKGTMVEYDFASLEREIEERLIRGRPTIKADQMVQMSFRQESSTVTKLLQLRKTILPEMLPINVEREIEEELKNKLNIVNESLARLDIAVGYLASVASNPHDSLHDFMINTLKMDKGLSTSKASVFQLRHVESLWLLLSHVHAKHMEQLGQDSFNEIHLKYREKLLRSEEDELRKSLLGANLDLFMPVLFECIHFKLTALCVTLGNDLDHISNENLPLGESVNVYLEESLRKTGGVELPSSLRVHHCVETWRFAFAMNRPSGAAKKML